VQGPVLTDFIIIEVSAYTKRYEIAAAYCLAAAYKIYVKTKNSWGFQRCGDRKSPFPITWLYRPVKAVNIGIENFW